jgi:3-phenylpropionate/cinnamic acid dioxygenase small subunit
MSTDVEDIRDLMARYAQALDDGRFDDWAACFTPDGVLAFGDMTIVGRLAIREFGARTAPPGRQVHLNNVSSIDLSSSGATGTTDWVTVHVIDEAITVNGAGRYHDEYVSVSGRWLFARRDVMVWLHV